MLDFLFTNKGTNKVGLTLFLSQNVVKGAYFSMDILYMLTLFNLFTFDKRNKCHSHEDQI